MYSKRTQRTNLRGEQLQETGSQQIEETSNRGNLIIQLHVQM